MNIEIKNDDCFNIISCMPDKSVDLVIADPPYDIKRINKGGSVNDIKGLNKSLSDLEASGMIHGYNIAGFGDEIMRVMKSVNIYFWCNKAQISEYFNYYVNKHKCKFDIICWHKTNALPTYFNKYLSDTEYLLYFRKGSGKCRPQSYEDAKTFYIAPINHADKNLYGHPTIKPLDLTEKIIRNSSAEGDTVLDPFMGSGTTGVACCNTKRNFIGAEINDKYFEIAKKRINEAIINNQGENYVC